MDCYALTDTGRVRKQNEDYLKIDMERRLFIVADGMGGHQAGEVASREAVEIFLDDLPNDAFSGEEMVDSLMHVNQQLHRMAEENPAYRGMGTTFTAAWVSGGKAVIVHVGDSRAYRVHNGEITQLTEDHTLPNELFRMGKLTEKELKDHPDSHMLSKAVGTQMYLIPDLVEVPLESGDFLILSSDGLSNRMESLEMLKTVQDVGRPKEIVNTLVDLANMRGGQDNISVICLKYIEDKESENGR